MPQSPLAFVTNYINSLGASAQRPGRVDAQSALFVADRHSEGYESTYLGKSGFISNPTAVTLSAALATTYVGLCLSNPAGSGVNLELLEVAGALSVAPAALTQLGLITGYSAAGIVTHTTALTPQNALVGSSAAGLQGLVDSACTLVGTPVWSDVLAETPAATSVVQFYRDIKGRLLIPPGGYVAIGADIAGPASGFRGSMMWSESPL